MRDTYNTRAQSERAKNRTKASEQKIELVVKLVENVMVRRRHERVYVLKINSKQFPIAWSDSLFFLFTVWLS